MRTLGVVIDEVGKGDAVLLARKAGVKSGLDTGNALSSEIGVELITVDVIGLIIQNGHLAVQTAQIVGQEQGTEHQFDKVGGILIDGDAADMERRLHAAHPLNVWICEKCSSSWRWSDQTAD